MTPFIMRSISRRVFASAAPSIRSIRAMSISFSLMVVSFQKNIAFRLTLCYNLLDIIITPSVVQGNIQNCNIAIYGAIQIAILQFGRYFCNFVGLLGLFYSFFGAKEDSMNLDIIKKTQRERGVTNKRLAEITGTHESTLSRYLSGEVRDVPFDFVAKAAFYLELPLDEIAGNPQKVAHDELYEHIRDLYEAVMNEKEAQIAELHEQIKDQRRRMDRKNAIIAVLVVVMIFVAGYAVYWVLDALNGDWGRIRYELYAAKQDIWSHFVDIVADIFTV